MTSSSDLVGLLQAVDRHPAQRATSFSDPDFVALRDHVQATYSTAGANFGLNFALSAALDRLGIGRRSGAAAADVVAAAVRLDAAFRATHVDRVHLCPLDMADEIPDLHFGPNSISTLSLEDLQTLLAPIGPRAMTIDRRFTEFKWLIVRERVPVEHDPGHRALPLLYDMSEDFARIEPHKRRHTVAVERAIFGLLLAPWEDLVDHADFNWRAFRIPWVYTIEDDPFVRPAALPSADSLSWEPRHADDGTEEGHEYEAPAAYHYQSPIVGAEAFVGDDRWHEVERALASDLFSTPVVHFLVAAFLGEGIDEFIGHLTAMEAGLGLWEDQGGVRVMKARISALLQDSAAANTYGELFNLRSEYVHGRTMGDISGKARVSARRLAREIATALVDAVPSLAQDRQTFLQGLAPSKVPKAPNAKPPKA